MSQTRIARICHFTYYVAGNRQEDPLAWLSLISTELLQYTKRLRKKKWACPESKLYHLPAEMWTPRKNM